MSNKISQDTHASRRQMGDKGGGETAASPPGASCPYPFAPLIGYPNGVNYCACGIVPCEHGASQRPPDDDYDSCFTPAGDYDPGWKSCGSAERYKA